MPKLVALPGDDRPDPRLSALSTVSAEQASLFDAYFREGGAGNIGNALRLALALVRGETFEAPAPAPLGPAILMSADGSVIDIPQWAASTQGALGAALVIFYRSSLLADDFAPVRALMLRLAAEGLDPAAVALTSLKDPAAAEMIDALIAARRPSVIINTTAFSARRTDDTTVLDAADCPVLQVALAGTSNAAWEASDRGLAPSDLAMHVVLPELDGRLFTRAISFKAETPVDAEIEYVGMLHEPAADRVAFVASLAAAWARLGATPRDARRLAIMLSDYPARGGRTGYACGLDTPESAREIVSLLADAGYSAGDGLSSASDILARLTSEPRDHLRLSLAEYREHLETLPAEVRDTLDAAWGNPADDPACVDGEFRFPCLRAGNIVVLLQPDRGARGDRKQGYHDTSCPPRHGYVALYACLRRHERIDALVHLGTHGTLEWLPGKALALSEQCFPEAVLGPVPVIYPFIVNNPGEAVQAKRRISAVTIGHLTPPLSAAGLHGPLAELEGLLEEYAEADGVDRRRVPLIEAEILERAWRSGLAADCGLARDDAPRAAIAKLDAQLCDIKDLAIRDSLHVFGRAPEAAARDALAQATLRSLSPGAQPDLEPHVHALIEACAASERSSLLAALDGRRVAPGPAGAPTRGRLDVLPTGRNLTTIDPRAVPTRTAAAIGARAAAEVVRRHLQDKGEYPRSIMLDLWASASLRTGGDDLAQALSYLGARPVWDTASNRVTGVEVLPLALLERPRIDVTLRISGLFRDIFQSQIALFDMAVARVAALDEDDEWNPLAAARRAGGGPGAHLRRGEQRLRRRRRRDRAGHGLGDQGRPRRSVSRRLDTRLRSGRRWHRSKGRLRRARRGSRCAGASAGRPRARPSRRRRRRRLRRRVRRRRRHGGAHPVALSPRYEPSRSSGRPHDPGGNRPHRARAPHQSALDQRHAGARPSRHRRDGAGSRCALRLRGDRRRRARPSVRYRARRADCRRDGDRAGARCQPCCGGGDGCAAGRRDRARAMDAAAQRRAWGAGRRACGGSQSSGARMTASGARARRLAGARLVPGSAAADAKRRWAHRAAAPARASHVRLNSWPSPRSPSVTAMASSI